MGRLRSELVLLFDRATKVLAVAFMFLLVSAAVLLALGRESTANKVAEVAYYMLVGAVASAIASVALEERGSEQGGGEGC